MTIIHVTIPDHAEALGVVATLLKQGYYLRVDLDGESEPTVGPPWLAAEMTRREWVEAFQANSSVAVERGLSTPKRAQRDPLKRPFVDERQPQRPTLESGQVATVYGARVARDDDNNYFINGLQVSEAEFNQEMAERSMARYERAMESEQAINEVACPLCKQERGERCITAAGSSYSWHKVHKPRWHAYVTRGDDVTPAR